MTASISAIPATVKVLMDLDVLHQRFGQTIVSAAEFDDVIGLFLLAVLTGVIQTGDGPRPPRRQHRPSSDSRDTPSHSRR